MSWPFWSSFLCNPRSESFQIGPKSKMAVSVSVSLFLLLLLLTLPASTRSYKMYFSKLKNIFVQIGKCISPNWLMNLSEIQSVLVEKMAVSVSVSLFFLLLLTRPAWTRSQSLNPAAPEIWFSDRFSLKFDEEIFHISWHLFYHHTITILKQFVEDNLMIIDKNHFHIQDFN